ncbi:MAG: hypothetical protein MR009_05035, partial [Sutterellaceae bacterium]|nr:hypothetical protein [Sutterellaceae bacterium]
YSCSKTISLLRIVWHKRLMFMPTKPLLIVEKADTSCGGLGLRSIIVILSDFRSYPCGLTLARP